MLRLKKTQPAPVEPPSEAISPSSSSSPSPSGTSTSPETTEAAPGLSLLGIGGVSLSTDSTTRRGRKRTPGEIRIQKGNS